jgi:hypothetical protein
VKRIIMNMADYARYRGCAKQSVARAIATGRIAEACRQDAAGHWSIDIALADELWAARTVMSMRMRR